MRKWIDIVESQYEFLPVEPRYREEEVSVLVDPEKIMASWKSDKGMFFDHPQHDNAIKGRYERFGEWVKQGKPIGQSEIYVNPWGDVSFGNGRHRFLWLYHNGLEKIPVLVPIDQKEEFERRFS